MSKILLIALVITGQLTLTLAAWATPVPLEIHQLPHDVPVRVGIYIGTFDPPHTGHLKVANEAVLQGHVDYILMLANDRAQHKPLATPFYLRYHMTRIMSEGQSRIIAPTQALVSSERGYVEGALEQLQKIRPNARLVGIMGDDLAHRAHEFYMDQRFWMGIVESFLVNYRESREVVSLPSHIEGRPLVTFDAKTGGVSSSDIRAQVESGRRGGPLHPQVLKTILENKLWHPQVSCRMVFVRL